MHHFIALFGLLTLELIRIIVAGSTTTYHIDTCDETGRKALFCEDGEVIQIVDVRLMPHNFSSLERDVVANLCNGLNSCSFVDLRKQLFYYCQDYPNKQVYTSFKCIPASAKPVCRTNICSADNPNIKCRRGYVFHLIDTKCFSMSQNCPKEVFVQIYRTCEGQRQCQLSIIRAGIPQSICNDSLFRQQNLFMDFICVDKSVVTSTCSGHFIDQKPRFGILQNSGYPNNPIGNKDGCYWVIYRDKTTPEEIEVTVHEAYSVEGQHLCDSQFLQVQYTLCETLQQTIDRFCDEGRVNVVIRSCGTVYVTHYKFLKGEDRGNRFLVSYSVKQPSASIEPYEQYASPCEKRNSAIFTVRYTLPQPQTTKATAYVKPTTGRLLLPEDQPINDSSVGDPEVEPTKEVKNEDKESFDPWRMVTLLRVVVVNVFLGLLIVALIMALAFVCYRYIILGKEKKRETAKKSETATTLDDKQSTEMQLLPQDGEVVPSSSNRQGDKSHESPCSDIKQDSSTYETTIFHFNRPNTDTDDETIFCDSGSGVSSFLPHPPLRRSNGKQQNAESAYSSLDDEQEDLEVYSQIHDHHRTNYEAVPNRNVPNNLSAQLVKQLSIDDERRQTGEMPLQNLSHHLNINEDNYAVVKKIPNHRNHKYQSDSPDAHHHNVIDNCKESENRHIHAVPEDNYSRDHMSATTMQLIPEHDCLLHKIPPPPPPPTRVQALDSPATSSYSSVQADV
ncbi:uncharacterized protein LOC132732606 isoform X2 [Ruditapes philippinarum]|uniref:uncharacterized protein LOC132732606 isoform X2 n=1 Tax=Ruditapes philippinarum TaxID=129788 RepID=UPI00295A6E33|nr:uncharacterized protein LOC132732606 isoform X2 [Ruditapes philippinarum]